MFNVKGEDETEKTLHRNYLFLLGFMDSGATETEKGATDVKNDHDQKKETEIKATAVEKEIVIDKGSEKVEAIEDDSSDEDDDSVTEFVSHMYITQTCFHDVKKISQSSYSTFTWLLWKTDFQSIMSD